MPKTKKQVKVIDQTPTNDPKGGGGGRPPQHLQGGGGSGKKLNPAHRHAMN